MPGVVADPIAACISDTLTVVDPGAYDGTDGYDDGLYDTGPGSVTVAGVLSGVYGPVSMRYRFEQRTSRNAAIAELSEAIVVASSTIDLDNDRAVLRTANFTIRRSMMPSDFDYLTQCIAVFAEIQANGSWGRIQLGLFRLDEPEETYGFTTNDVVVAKGSDVSILLAQPATSLPYTVVAGTNYITAIEALISSLSLNYSFAASALATPVDFTWPPGTPQVTIINDLLRGINWFDVYADEYGTLTSRERVSPFDEVTSPYQTTAEPRMIRGTLVLKRSATTPPNRIIAKIDDPQREPFSVLIDNIDPNSPTSILRVPIKASEINVDRALSQDVAADVGTYELRIAAGKGEQATMTTHPDPVRGAHEVYTITYYDNEIETKWRVASWSMALGTGVAMTHTLERAGSFITADNPAVPVPPGEPPVRTTYPVGNTHVQATKS